MLKVFKLDGLDCAHCAAKIEDSLRELEGVISANVSFLTARLELEVDDVQAEKVLAAAKSLISKVDDDITVCD